MGIVSDRRRKQRAARMRRRLWILSGALLLGVLSMTPELSQMLRIAGHAVQALSQSAQAELTLGAMDVYALQLGVYDNGERAAAQAQRLQSDGVRCMIWQSEKMRIIASAALSREELDMDAAMGHDAYVIRESLEEVTVRLSCGAAELENVRALLKTPDTVFTQLLSDEKAAEMIVADVRQIAGKAAGAHPENALYTQLAQSLENWCALMENTMENETQEQRLRSYGAVTMCTLCRELRLALSQQASSAASTASAQRTPSTAADVMPPA